MTTQPSLPPPPQQPNGGVQVRCAGCRMILTVRQGLTEFSCPTCQLPQMLPPELMAGSRGGGMSLPSQDANVKPPSHVPAHGIDPTKIQLPCASCKAILNVPHGLVRFSCPQCAADLAVDLSKVKYFPPPPPRPPLLLPPEEVNEVSSFSLSLQMN